MSGEDSSTYRHLDKCFGNCSLLSNPTAEALERAQSDEQKEQAVARDRRCVLVHFLDPGATTSLRPTPQQRRQSLMERFESIFQNTYKNRLPNVPYQDARSKITHTIPFVNVQCRFLESQVDLLQSYYDGDSGDGIKKDVVDAWHSRPYCHVYFVTGCQTIEEYRTKVKPSIQVFLSQIDDVYQRQAMQLSASSSAASLNSGMTSEDDLQPPFLIVFCPSRPAGSAPVLPPDLDAEGNPVAGQRFFLGNRIRNRLGHQPSLSSGDGTMADAANDTTTNTTSASTSDPSSGENFNPFSVLTKLEKEVAKRMALDFPQGNMATLTTLGNDYQSNLSNAHLKAALEELERNEWQVLLQALSKTVIQGFETICGGLLSSLRKISNKRQSDRSNIGHYFLMKESLAFTYEQMNLPAEALLQYKELRAFLPDLPKALEVQMPPEEDALEGIDGAERQTKNFDWPQVTPVWDVRKMSCTDFRKHIQGLHYEDYYLVAPATEMYLWERETALASLLGDHGTILKKSCNFVADLWLFHSKLQPITKYDLSQVETWAFQFAWDLIRAARQFLNLQEKSPKAGTYIDPFNVQLFEIVEFARTRLDMLAELKKDIACNSQGAICSKFQDITKPWEPWTPQDKQQQQESEAPPLETFHLDVSGKEFLDKAFLDRNQFLLHYTDALKFHIIICKLCARIRTAARFTLELVDLFVEQGQMSQAEKALQSVAKIYARDGWNDCHFLVHFRLAGFRRNWVGPRDYLATLFHCFSCYSKGKFTVMPHKALEMLCQDFEAVMGVLGNSSSDSDETRYSNSPIFEAAFRHPEIRNRKKILRRKVFYVGEEMKIIFALQSHLPRRVDDVAITAELVPHSVYTNAQKQKTVLGPEDVCLAISLAETACINPGANEYQILWVPMVSGQFVVAQFTLKYKSTSFVYTHDKMKEMGFWMDILPVEPTQSMIVKPLFLIPGHEQRLQIQVLSGGDHIESGELSLVCSPGLVVSAEEEEGVEWVSNLKLPLNECPPKESRLFSFLVTGAATPSFDDNDTAASSAIPTVHAKVTTSFRYGNKDKNESSNSNSNEAQTVFQHEMESVIPTLVEHALTVGDICFIPYKRDRAILSVVAKCHVPAPFLLQKWDLDLPSYLKVSDSTAAINKACMDTTLVKGETICFAFDCSSQASDVKLAESSALVVELQDEHSSVFQEQLLLRLKKRTALANVPDQIHKISVRVKLSSTEGMVGVPIRVTYYLDTSALVNWKGQVLYTVDTNNDAWLVAGNTKGVVPKDDGKEWNVTFCAIPTRPTLDSTAPSMELKLEGGGLDSPHSMHFFFDKKDSRFRASHPAKHSTIAFLAS